MAGGNGGQLSTAQRKALLDARIAALTADGFRVLARTDTTATVVRFRAMLGCLGLILVLTVRVLTAGLLGDAAGIGPETLYLSVDEYGQVTEATRRPTAS